MQYEPERQARLVDQAYMALGAEPCGWKRVSNNELLSGPIRLGCDEEGWWAETGGVRVRPTVGRTWRSALRCLNVHVRQQQKSLAAKENFLRRVLHTPSKVRHEPILHAC